MRVKLLFENEEGRLHIHGGGRHCFGDGLYLQRIHGLGLAEREYLTTSYVNQPGQELISEKDGVRLVTLSMDLCYRQNIQSELRRMLKILYRPGVLTVHSGALNRKIGCRCTKVEEPVWHGKQIASLVLQFTCDKPYFTDIQTMQETLFSRTDLVSGRFMLPCVFTERITRRTLVNRGDVPSEPIMTVYGVPRERMLLSDNSGIAFINHTTGQQLHLLYELSEAECVTMDIPNRHIVSDQNGNVTFSLGQGSYLSNFWLEPGPNDVEVINYYTGVDVNVSIAFEHRYLEAVV